MLLLGYYAAQTPAVAAGSYDLIQSEILTGSQASVTFDVTGLGSTYQHLQIRAVARSTRAAANENVRVQFNSDTSSVYSRHQLRGTGSSVISEAATSQTSAFVSTIAAASSTANSFTAQVTDILDPFETGKNTTIRTLYGATSYQEIGLSSGAWFDTSAVTSIELILQSGGSFTQYSRFSLYAWKVA